MKNPANYIALGLIVCAIASGCATKKNDASANIPPMNSAALDIPAPSTAPPAQYSPAQPVMTQAPAMSSEEPADEIALAEEAPATPTRARSSGTKYKVKKGESLWSIAQAKYGNGNKWKTIAAANPGMNPDKIQAGQTITLP